MSSHRVLPTIEEVRSAADRLSGVLMPTQLTLSEALSDAADAPVYIKREFENPTGSFKVRGALNALASLPEGLDSVVASSAGNHGLGVAFAAHRLGVAATIYVPSNAPDVKKDGIRALGAGVDDSAPDYDAAMARAIAHASDHNIPFINPCLGIELLAGQGTVALEILVECPDLATLVVCTGGGGLLGGCGTVMRALSPATRVAAAQSVRTSAMTQSIHAGHVVQTRNEPTLADGLAGQIDADALIIGQKAADTFALVTEDEIGETIAWLWRAEGIKAEGAGAVAAAAIRHQRIDHLEGPIVVIVSGGNIDDSLHETLLRRYPNAA